VARNRRKFQTGELRCCAIRPQRLPLERRETRAGVAGFVYTPSRAISGEDLERELRRRFDSVTTLRRGHQNICEGGEFETAGAGFVRRRDSCAVCAVSDRKGDVDVPADQFPLIQQIYKNGKPVFLSGLEPYLIERFPQAEHGFPRWISDVAQISVARRVVWRFPFAAACR